MPLDMFTMRGELPRFRSGTSFCAKFKGPSYLTTTRVRIAVPAVPEALREDRGETGIFTPCPKCGSQSVWRDWASALGIPHTTT